MSLINNISTGTHTHTHTHAHTHSMHKHKQRGKHTFSYDYENTQHATLNYWRLCMCWRIRKHALHVNACVSVDLCVCVCVCVSLLGVVCRKNQEVFVCICLQDSGFLKDCCFFTLSPHSHKLLSRRPRLLNISRSLTGISVTLGPAGNSTPAVRADPPPPPTSGKNAL